MTRVSAILSVPAYAAGDVVAERYELVRPLGHGGMGVVWLAHDRVLNVEVALKLILHPMREAAARAQTEARAAARLAHPAVCRVADYGRSDRDDPFVVSELLMGETLDELLERQGTLTPIEAVRALLPILEALEAAHACGIVHRDVKPSNVFLAHANRRIQPKLLDFGIARWIGENTRHTTTGSVVGTPDYMSPEQARGSRDVGTATDIWSFSATLYEVLTGSAPFHGENYNEVLWAIQNVEPTSLTSFCAGDVALADIVMRGLRRDAGERWGSAAELGCELSRWLLAQGVDTDLCGNSVRSRALEHTRASELEHAAASLLPSRSAITTRRNASRAASSGSRQRRSAVRGGLVAVFALSLMTMGFYAIKLVASTPDDGRDATQVEPVVESDRTSPTPPSPERAPIARATRPATASNSPALLSVRETRASERPLSAIARTMEPTRAAGRVAERVSVPATAKPAPSPGTDPAVATPPSPSVATASSTEPRARPNKTNALGYDFGL